MVLPDFDLWSAPSFEVLYICLVNIIDFMIYFTTVCLLAKQISAHMIVYLRHFCTRSLYCFTPINRTQPITVYGIVRYTRKLNILHIIGFSLIQGDNRTFAHIIDGGVNERVCVCVSMCLWAVKSSIQTEQTRKWYHVDDDDDGQDIYTWVTALLCRQNIMLHTAFDAFWAYRSLRK